MSELLRPQLTVFDLLDKYKSVDEIPDYELKEIGYARQAPGKIYPVVFEAALVDRKKAKLKNKEKWQHKLDNTPFSRIEVATESTGGIFRFVKKEVCTNLYKSIDSLDVASEKMYYFDELEGFFETIIPNQNDLLKFMNRFLGPLNSDHLNFLLFNELPITIDLYSNRPDLDPDLFLGNYEEGLSGEKTRDLSRDLEKLRGRLADVSRLEANFRELLGEELINADRLEIKNDPRQYMQIPYMQAQKDFIVFFEDKVTTNQDFILYCFSHFLELEGEGEIATELRKCANLDQIRSLFKDITGIAPKILVDEQKELESEIKDAPLEKKKEFSGRLKEIKEQIKNRHQLLAGMGQYFELPTLLSEYYNREINKMQEVLIKKGEGAQVLLYLDASWDSELDKDPGKISGDCTEGSPLPFADPEIPIYNVKVFQGDNNEHIGNIYLLKSENENRYPIWHLDAINIPAYFNWDQTIEAIIQSLAGQAKEQNIAMITVNEIPELISNYDYIQKAVAKYQARLKYNNYEGFLEKIPKSKSKRFSDLQTTGVVHALWINPKNQ